MQRFFNSQRAQASMETMLLIGGIILVAIIVLVVLLSMLGAFQPDTTSGVPDLKNQVNNLG